MDDNLIGLGVCPVCANKKARFAISKKSLACMTCNTCNIQIFARSDSSDEKLRSFIRADAPEPETTPAPVEKTTDAPPQKTPAKTGFDRPGWGILGVA